MTYEEYQVELKRIDDEALKSKTLLAKLFCEERREYKVGDILTDGHWIMKVESLKFSTEFFRNQPVNVYVGPLLKKDLSPTKKREIVSLYANRDISLLKIKPKKL